MQEYWFLTGYGGIWNDFLIMGVFFWCDGNILKLEKVSGSTTVPLYEIPGKCIL